MVMTHTHIHKLEFKGQSVQMIHTYIHTYIQTYMSFLYSAYKFNRVTMRLIDRVEPNGRMDRLTDIRTLPIALPSRLTRSVNVNTTSV